MHRSVLSVALLALALCLALISVPGGALAQVTCPATNGNDGNANNVRVLIVERESPSTCGARVFNAISFDTGEISRAFTLYLPGDAPRTGVSNPVRVGVRNAAGTVLDVTSLTCAGASSIAGIGTSAGAITLADGRSCQLSVTWENGDRTIAYSGATLSRTGDVYAIDGSGVLSGDQFGGDGVRPAGAEIFVTGNDVPITSGNSSPSVANLTDFGGVAAGGGSREHAFDIGNRGLADLALNGTPRVAITGPHAGDFTVVREPSATIRSGRTKRLSIRFTPSAAGLRQATVSIANNDDDENPFTFQIQGTGGAAAIGVSGNSLPITAGATSAIAADGTDFGRLDASSRGTVERTFTISSSGTIPLSLTGSPRVEISGRHADDFEVIRGGRVPATIATGASSNVTIRFSPSAPGERRATVSIANNSANANPFTFAIRGEAGGADIVFFGKGIQIASGDTTPAIPDGTDFGPAVADGGTATRTYMYRNTGDTQLILNGTPIAEITGPNADDFEIVGPLNKLKQTTLQPGFSTGITIAFKPSAIGLRQATVSIANNVSDKSPYTFAIQGEGTATPAPEIAIFGANDALIASGDNSPAGSDGTDFGERRLTSLTRLRSFTVRNFGVAPLVLTGSPRISITGEHAGDFTVDSSTVAPAEVQPGRSFFFRIAFGPTEVGLRRATVSIASNDDDRTPYTFDIQGEGTGPDISVSGNGVSIEPGDASPAAGDGTDFGSADLRDGAVERVFKIINDGNQRLVLNGRPRIEITGDNREDFEVIDPFEVARTIDPGGETNVTIRFKPEALGPRRATVSIASNDDDENPFTFDIAGQGTGEPILEPEIEISGNGVAIADGEKSVRSEDGTDFGAATIGDSAIERVFTIANNGTGPLALIGNPRVQFLGRPGRDFEVVGLDSLPTSIAAGGKIEITVRFAPTVVGRRKATVFIDNDDEDEAPYTFNIEGEGVAAPEPEIVVFGVADADGVSRIEIFSGDRSPTDEDGTEFKPAAVGEGFSERVFTIANIGDGPLVLNGTPRVRITGDHAGDFEVVDVSDVPTSIATRTETDVTIRFRPSAGRLRRATVSIANNDKNENPYTFAIAGQAIAAAKVSPVISVSGNDQSITDGDATPSDIDGTDFGETDTSSGSVARTFTVANAGEAELILEGSPRVVITGPAAEDFTVTRDATSPVVARTGATSFTIAFEPSATGSRRATVSIANNDELANPFTFDIQGEGTTVPARGPKISVIGNGEFITSGDTTPSDEDGTDFGRVQTSDDGVARTFAIANTGDAALILEGAPRVVITGPAAADFKLTRDATTPLAARIDATPFSIKFTPTAGGLRQATVSIASNDDAASPFTFAIQGEGVDRQVRERTGRIISNFMRRRADQITANAPDLSERLTGGGAVGAQAEGTPDTHSLTIAGGLRQSITAHAARHRQQQGTLAQAMALGTGGSPAVASQSHFDIWFKLTQFRVDGVTELADFGLLTVGADYRVNPSLVIGLFGQFDRVEEEDVAASYSIDGNGWMAGPYLVARLHDNLIFDGRAAWGQSTNTISPFLTYTDTFDTERWLVTGKLTGDLRFGALHLAPQAGVTYYEDQQKSYTDSLGNTIGPRRVQLGRATFGPKVSAHIRSRDGTTITPFVAVEGIWDFTGTDIVDIKTGLAAASGGAKLRARTEAGVSITLPAGVLVSGEGFYDGIGDDSFVAYGGSVKMKVPF